MKTATRKQSELDEMDILSLYKLDRGYCFRPEAGGFTHKISPEERKKIGDTLERRLGAKPRDGVEERKGFLRLEKGI